MVGSSRRSFTCGRNDSRKRYHERDRAYYRRDYVAKIVRKETLLEQSLKLREREYAIEQIEGKTMRSDTKKSIRNIL